MEGLCCDGNNSVHILRPIHASATRRTDRQSMADDYGNERDEEEKKIQRQQSADGKLALATYNINRVAHLLCLYFFVVVTYLVGSFSLQNTLFRFRE